MVSNYFVTNAEWSVVPGREMLMDVAEPAHCNTASVELVVSMKLVERMNPVIS
jgi:hypothetical protein